MQNDNRNWTEVYFAQFGRKLDEEETQAIRTELEYVFRGSLKAWEVNKALRTLAIQSGVKARKYPPAGQDIIRAIKANRVEYIVHKRGESLGHVRYEPGDDGRMQIIHDQRETWEAQLRAARNPSDRWDVVCRPAKDADCRERELYCETMGLTLER